MRSTPMGSSRSWIIPPGPRALTVMNPPMNDGIESGSASSTVHSVRSGRSVREVSQASGTARAMQVPVTEKVRMIVRAVARVTESVVSSGQMLPPCSAARSSR